MRFIENMRYVTDTEFATLVGSVHSNDHEFMRLILLIYDDGFKISDALQRSKYNLTLRSAQRTMKLYSEGQFTLQDLYASHQLNVLYKLIKSKMEGKNG